MKPAIQHHHEHLNGTDQHFVSQGLDNTGPLIVFCHGFPGLWYSWRKQLPVLAAAGYRVVALDMRGYGATAKPDAAADYDLDRVRGDLLAVLDHLDVEQAVFAGHDFGAPVVWHMALAAPERVQALAVFSVPYDHDFYGRYGQGHRGDPAPQNLPSQNFAAYAQDSFLHAHYFQQMGVADQELGDNAEVFLQRIYWALSAEGDLLGAFAKAKPGMGYLDVLPPAPALPWRWMDAEAMDYYVSQFQAGGFTGPLNWYRVADRNWQINARYLGQPIHCPSLFIAGEQDPVLTMSGAAALDFMREAVPGLRDVIILPKAGHWVQMEQAEAVNQALLSFLGDL